MFSFNIKKPWDVDAAVHRIKKLCELEGKVRERALLIAKELSTNIVKYAGEGELRLDCSGEGVSITARDHGPGIEKLEEAVKDGFAKGRYLVTEKDVIPHKGLGAGLSAVMRLADNVDIKTDDNGTLVKALIKSKNRN